MILQSMLAVSQMVLKVGLLLAGLKDSALKKRLKERDFVVLIKTKDRKTAKYFVLKGGRLLSKLSGNRVPDVVIEWKDASAILKVVKNTSLPAITDAFSNALTSGDLTLEVQLEPAVWFAETMKDVAGFYAGLGQRRCKG